MTFVFAAAMVGYAVAIGIVIRWAQTPTPLPEVAHWPDVAVLVAARNEELTLPACLAALRQQQYPGNLTVYVADDHSTDGTAEVVRHCQKEGFDTLRLITAPTPQGSLIGKANALHASVQASSAPLLLITDADCAPPPHWARSLAAYLAQDGVGMVCGRTAIVRDEHLRTSIEALDWAYLLSGAGFLAEVGYPVTGMGNNMGIRRQAYDEVGGYPALQISVTEDYALLRALADKTSWRIRFPNHPDAVNKTQPAGSLGAAYRQRARWARGGIRAPWWVYPGYAAFYAIPLLITVGFFVVPGLSLAAFAIKIVADYGLLRQVLKEVSIGYLLAWETFQFAYTLSIPAYLAANRRLQWKGRSW